MSAGVIVLFAALVSVGLLFGVQVMAQRRMSAMSGQAAPEVPGVLAFGDDAVLFFHSPSCGPCRMMAPQVKSLAASDRRVQSIDVSASLESARAFRVMTTPTTILVRAGTVAEVRLGAMPPAALAAMVAELPPRAAGGGRPRGMAIPFRARRASGGSDVD
ncbi:MAG: thioredoxin 1 [Myxococcota bacterium]|jgi:thioredoxin 1